MKFIVTKEKVTIFGNIPIMILSSPPYRKREWKRIDTKNIITNEIKYKKYGIEIKKPEYVVLYRYCSDEVLCEGSDKLKINEGKEIFIPWVNIIYIRDIGNDAVENMEVYEHSDGSSPFE